MRFFVIRHGETAWNVEGRFQGQQDTALNEKGLAQAATLGERLAGHSFEAVLTSPLDRAKKTAELAASKCEFGEFTEIPAFTEINHGDWEGRLSTEVAAEWPELLRRWHGNGEGVDKLYVCLCLVEFAVFVAALKTGCALVAATGLAVEIGAGPALTATGSTDPLAPMKML